MDKGAEQAPPAKTEAAEPIQGTPKSVSFVENRRGKEVPHNGFFYYEYKTYEACENGTKQLLDTIPNKNLISGYKIVYDERLNTYVGQLLGPDGKLIEDMSKLFNP